MIEFFQIVMGVFRFYDDIKALIAFRQAYSDEKWIEEGAAITKAIKAAKTDDERRELVRRLADHQSGA